MMMYKGVAEGSFGLIELLASFRRVARLFVRFRMMGEIRHAPGVSSLWLQSLLMISETG